MNSTLQINSHKIHSEPWDKADSVLPKPAYSRVGAAAKDTSKTGTVEKNTSVDVPWQVMREKLNLAPLIRLSEKGSKYRRFQVLQQWEAVVREVSVDNIFVELHDLTDTSFPYELAELPCNEIPDEDRLALTRGSVLYWTIGYHKSIGGQISRVSEIRLRRTPLWSGKQLNEIRTEAKVFLSWWNANDGDIATSSE